MLTREDPQAKIAVLPTCTLARRKIIEQDFDLCIINAPLHDETGESLAATIARKGICQVILIVKTDLYDEISEKVEGYGVFTLAKPINKALFWNILKLAHAAYNKIMQLQNQNDKLLNTIQDIKLIDRAKLLLIEKLGLSENQAHKYIERQAMLHGLTKRKIAQNIVECEDFPLSPQQ